MSIRNQLKWLRHFDVLVQSKKQELARLRGGLYRTANFLKENEQAESSESLTVKIIDGSSDIAKDIERMYQKREELVRAIDSLSDPTASLVLRLFYLDGHSWKAISRKLSFSSRQLQRLRNEALEELEKQQN